MGPRRRGSASPGQPPYTRGIYPTMYRGRLWTMRQYSGFGTRRGDQRALQVPARRRPDRPVVRLRPADADGLRLRPPARRGRGRQGRRGHRLARRHARCCSHGLPLDTVTTSMTINSTAAILLLLYELVAEEQGVSGRQDRRHDPERHPQGVRRPRHLHLPAAAVDADHHRHLRLLPRATCRSGTRSRSPATTSARPAAPRCRRSPSRSPTASPTSQAAIDAGPRRRRVRAAARRSSGTRHNNFFEEVAKFRAARRMWYRIMSERFGAKNEKSQAAALPHPDRRLDAHRAAAGEQRRARRAAGAGRGASAARRACTPTASTRRSACRPSGPRTIALRTQQIIGYETRRHRHRRSARRLVLRRVAHRRGRGRGLGVHREDRRDGRRGRRDRGRLPCRTRSSRPPTSTPRSIDDGEQGHRRRQQVRRRRRRRARRLPDRPRARAPAGRAARSALRAERDQAAVDGRARPTCAPRRRARRTCCRR